MPKTYNIEKCPNCNRSLRNLNYRESINGKTTPKTIAHLCIYCNQLFDTNLRQLVSNGKVDTNTVDTDYGKNMIERHQEDIKDLKDKINQWKAKYEAIFEENKILARELMKCRMEK